MYIPPPFGWGAESSLKRIWKHRYSPERQKWSATENYSFTVQEEIQSFHWDAAQRTIHSFVAYWRENDVERHQSFDFVFDETWHSASMVLTWIFGMTHSWITETGTGVEQNPLIFGWLRGAIQKSSISSTSRITPLTGITCEWHFFATSHGKSACDGIGGTIKRAMAKESLTRPYTGQIMKALPMFVLLTEKFETAI